MENELSGKICNVEKDGESLRIAIDAINSIEKYDNLKTIGFPTSKADVTTTSFASGYLTNDSIIKYDSLELLAKYRVDFENILPDFVGFIRRKKN